MKRTVFTLLAVLALALGTAAPAVAAGEPDVGQARWDSPENARTSDAGDILFRCATDERGPKIHIPKEQVDRWLSEGRIVAGGNIPVYVHVIHTANEGNVSDADINQQILVLNRNYAGQNYNGTPVPGAASTGYTFTLAGIDRRRNNKWFRMTPGSSAEVQAKNALSITPGSALNIYLCKPGQNLLGWAVFPWTSQAGTNQDGIVVHYGSLPNGYLSPYNLGGTASHEVGHYLGLYHTFQGGCGTSSCSTTGDLVCDTPAEATPTSGCPSGKDTCPATGLDPIHNYMDYSTDVCYDNFTLGQDARMNTIVTAYRSWIGATRVADPSIPGDDDRRPTTPDGIMERCATVERGNPKNAPDVRQIQEWIAQNRIAAGGVIPVNFHVIYAGSEGNVPESQLDAQIAVLNNNFAGKDYNGNTVSGAANTGYTFFKASVTRSNSRKWFRMTPGSQAETQAKNSLAVNWTSSLNLYTCKPGQNLLGWATFPWDLSANGKKDGVVVHYGSLPGGYLSPYNLGGTGSHEVGHWVGLYHTFQGGCGTSSCSTTGDLVCDTPAEATPTSGCPNGKDTCTAAGLDPIHNYMDYSTDICYTNFTTGQDARADFMMSTYRPLIGSARMAEGAGSIQAARDLDGGLVEFKAKPNPFNPRTKIEFGLRRAGHASVRVFDIQGRLVTTVVDRQLPPGNHGYDLDASKMASGIYLMVLKVRGEAQVVRRLSLLK